MTSTPNTGYLIEDQWDDWFQYSTMYDLYIVDSLSHQCYMGKTKIGQKGMVEDQRRPAPVSYTHLDVYKRQALSASPVQQQEAKQEKKDDLVGQEDQSRFAYLRQMNALKLEMKKAVHQENFERAAELRDQIRSLEAAHKEQKENK